ncbi:MAG TPA: hypothetical protein VF529_22215 [Solirubrobacteraceae bacterium]|jgi:hypothetical protein
MDAVRALFAAGVERGDIARETGVPYATVQRWLAGRSRAFGPSPPRPAWRPPDAWSYAYLLGIYLGDGTVSVAKSGKCILRVSLDGAYPGIVDECRMVIELTTMGGKTQVLYTPGSRVNTVQSSWKRWPEALPQHGPGMKHLRPIVLADWQQEIVDAHPRQFVRGPIHSDVCRTVNRCRAARRSACVGRCRIRGTCRSRIGRASRSWRRWWGRRLDGAPVDC